MNTYATVVVVCDDVAVGSWTLAGARPPDVAVVEELARVRLTARRMGCTIRLQEVSAELYELLSLLGLERVFDVCELWVEMLGEPERGEQPGVEEAVMPDDPIT